MNGVNKVILLGNVGNIYERSDDNFFKCSLATNNTYNKKDSDEKVTTTEWHNLVFFGKLSSIANKYLKKGDMIYIEGSLNTSSYEDKEGITRKSTSIKVNTLNMLPQKNKNNNDNDGNDAKYGDNFDDNCSKNDVNYEDVPF